VDDSVGEYTEVLSSRTMSAASFATWLRFDRDPDVCCMRRDRVVDTVGGEPHVVL
jgi:hypothetical protein